MLPVLCRDSDVRWKLGEPGFARTVAFPAEPILPELARLSRLSIEDLVSPWIYVSTVNHVRIWFASRHYTTWTSMIDHTDRQPGLYASTIMNDVPRVVEDAWFDPGNPGPARWLLRTLDGYNPGVLCVLGFAPRLETKRELATPVDLARSL